MVTFNEKTVRVPEVAGDLGDVNVHTDVVAKCAAQYPDMVVVSVDRDSRKVTLVDDDGAGLVPVPVELRLDDRFKAGDVDRLAVFVERQYPGWELAGVDVPARTATRARLDPVTSAVRRALARALLCQPWELDVQVEVVDGRLDEVFVSRLPPMPVERRAKLLEHAACYVIGNSGWKVRENQSTGTVRLVGGDPLNIPVRAPVDFNLLGSQGWSWLPFATDGTGQPVAWDLSVVPHGLIAGKTGSGKSIALEVVIVGALTAGAEVVVVDPTKRGLDFRWVQPFVRAGGWGCRSYDDAQAAMKLAYEEGARRRDVLDELGVPKWTELDDEQRVVHNIRGPVLVVVDEATSLIKEVPVPKALQKDDPEREEMEALNLAKARIMNLLGKIARELRFVGVHLIVGTQRFDVANFGSGAGELRENLGLRMQLGRSSRIALGMMMTDAEAAVEAHQAAHDVEAADTESNEPVKRPGRGVAEIDGVGTIALQGWFATHDELVAHLDAVGVRRRAEHLLLHASDVSSRVASPSPAATPPVPASVGDDVMPVVVSDSVKAIRNLNI